MKKYIKSAVIDNISDENSNSRLLAEIALNTRRQDELIRLAESDDLDVLRAVVQNPYITNEVWERLACCNDSRIWMAAYDKLGKEYSSPSDATDEDLLLKYAADLQWDVLEQLLTNPNLTYRVYEVLSRSPEYFVRRELSASANTPDDILRHMRSCDPVVSIRTQAKENLKLRSQYKEEE